MASVSLIVFSFCIFFRVEWVQSSPSSTSTIEATKQSKLNVGQANTSIAVQNSSLVQNNICTCGVFLTDQFIRGSPKPPTGLPPISKDIDEQVICSSTGVRQCINKCVESLSSFLLKSGSLICANLDRDCKKERAYLFVNNCNQGWYNTKFSSGREYCCKDGEFYKCPK